MTTTSSDSLTKYFATDSATVAQPTPVQTGAHAVTGTVGRAGTVEYSKATPAVVNEIYVVTKK